MDRLSACFFCGAATVGDQGRVRVVGDASATVTLCGDCTDKLDRLAGAAGVALSVATDPSDGDTGLVEDRPADPDHETGQTTADETPDEPSDDERDTPGIPDDATIFTDDGEGFSDPSADDVTEPSGPADAGAEESAAAGTADDRPLIPPDGDDTGTDRSFATSQAAGGRRETSHDPRQRDADERADDPTDEVGDDGDTPEEGGRDGDPGPDPDPDPDPGHDDDGGTSPSEVDVATVPRETYNKVVRLLQNRSFPVERETVVSVATSAYGLSRRDCDATLDALVEHGVLEEGEDGRRLYRT